MTKKPCRALVLACVAGLLSACATSGKDTPRQATQAPETVASCQTKTFQIPGHEKDKDGNDLRYTVTTADGLLSKHYLELVGRDLGNIELLLDCALVETDDPMVQALRGHVLVALGARYAAFNLSGRVGSSADLDPPDYDRMDSDAAAILTHIYNSELGIRHAMAELSEPALLPTATPRGDRIVGRILPVAVMAVKSEMPSIHRSSSLIKTAIALYRGDLSGIGDGGQVIATLVGKVLVLHMVGPAYVKDAREGLSLVQYCSVAPDAARCAAAKASASPQGLKVLHMAGGDAKRHVQLVWQQWDDQLTESCGRLSAYVGMPSSCIPSPDAVAKGFANRPATIISPTPKPAGG